MDILERDGFRCRSCGCGGRLEVDHIKPVRTHPELSYDPGNLQALCPSCHTRKTRIECGHPPPREDRQDWRQAVESLSRPGKGSITQKETKDA
ncbi:MAG: HNH endonuclease [Paracoccaceae bacterium]